METILQALTQNIPAAVALIVVVAYFLRAIDRIITQFQQMLTEERKTWQTIFDSQREALNLISNHIKQLGELLVQHDGWEREQSKLIVGNQEQIIENQRESRRMKAANKAIKK